MKRPLLFAGIGLLPLGWCMATGTSGMIGHMAGHMIAVAIAAPLIAWGLSESRCDPARAWPRIVTPMAMMLLELVTVWLWHLPALRNAALTPIVMVAEQACFFLSGLLLWSSVIHTPQRASGIGALLLTSMHMTLLGVLIGLAPRQLYPAMHHAGMDGITDQQLGGVVMLLIGAASYFLGGLALLGSLLRHRGRMTL